MRPDAALGALQRTFHLRTGGGWEAFRSSAGELCAGTAFVEWSLKVGSAAIDDQRALWACPYRETPRVADRLASGLLRGAPDLHRQLTHGAMTIGLGWHGADDTLKLYSTLRPRTLRCGAVAPVVAALGSAPPVEPTLTVGFARRHGRWLARYYLFWKPMAMTGGHRDWLESILGRAWTATLGEHVRGGLVVRETGDVDVAVAVAWRGNEASASCPVERAIGDTARREHRLARHLHRVTWLTAPLAKNPEPAALTHFNLYVRPALA